MSAPKNHCFVIGPIGDEGSPERIHADWLYRGIILPVFDKHFVEWVVERADKIATPGMVSSQIINRLHDVELVVADLSFHNANAFYEMSIRHKVGKPIIHLIRKGEKIPFDVIPHRAIPFSHVHPDDHEVAREQLRAAVAEAVQPGFQADNPIMHARARLEFEQNASPEMKMIADEIATLRARLDEVELSSVLAQENANRALGLPPISDELLRQSALGRALLGPEVSTHSLTYPSAIPGPGLSGLGAVTGAGYRALTPGPGPTPRSVTQPSETPAQRPKDPKG
jgi:hypothetical protein